MSDSTPSATAELLIMGPILSQLLTEIESRYTTHRWWQQEDQQAFLKEHGSRITILSTSAVFGASAQIIEALPNLQAIISFGVGYDKIDLDAAKQRGIVVTNTPGVLNECVADTALALMLSISRRISEAERFVRSGQWPTGKFPLGRKLGGKTCAIVGMGNIGRQIAQRAEAFGMNISYFGRRAQPELARYRFFDDLQALARDADYMILSIPGGKSTYHLINAQVLEALGPDGFLINVARGSVVDEAALVEALRKGAIAGAALDVFEHEPDVPAALMELDNVVLTPHLASGTHETRQAMSDLVLKNLEGYLKNGEVFTQVV